MRERSGEREHGTGCIVVGDRDGYRGAPRGNCQELRGEIKAAPVFRHPHCRYSRHCSPVAFYLSGTSQWLASTDRLRVTVSPESKRSLCRHWLSRSISICPALSRSFPSLRLIAIPTARVRDSTRLSAPVIHRDCPVAYRRGDRKGRNSHKDSLNARFHAASINRSIRAERR